MGIRKGLKEMDTARDSGSSVTWLKMPAGATWRIRFLDDFDYGTPATDAGAGIVASIDEHSSPQDFKRKAVCTRDEEGKCWACDQAFAKPKTGWGRRSKVYMNVLVNDGVNDPYVAIWQMGMARSTTFETLKETFIDEGSIANREWRVKRNGDGIDTTYLLRDLGVDATTFDFSEWERFDLDNLIRHVPYADQQAFYTVAPLPVEEDEPAF